jgi:hypothetical protein
MAPQVPTFVKKMASAPGAPSGVGTIRAIAGANGAVYFGGDYRRRRCRGRRLSWRRREQRRRLRRRSARRDPVLARWRLLVHDDRAAAVAESQLCVGLGRRQRRSRRRREVAAFARSRRHLARGVALFENAALAFWGTGSGDLWAVGGEYWGNPTFFGTVFHSADGGVTWSKQVGTYLPGDPMLPLFEGPFWGVWGSSANDLWVVGARGTIVRSTDGGASWAQVAIGTTSTLRAVWGRSATDVWVAGDGGIWHLE